MITPDFTIELPADLRVVHFVGIGGSGMSGIAKLFIGAGYTVTGSDVRDSAAITELRGLGAQIAIGHDARHVGDADALVVTGALWQDNPEYRAALDRGIPVLHRAVALKWLIDGKRLISVAGAHGKTTSTGMLVTALQKLGVDPSFVNGGVIQGLGTSSGFGHDELFVVEADESDGSFLEYATAVALVTNVDADHLDHYGSPEAFDEAFVRFTAAAGELVVISSDDPGAVRVTTALRRAEPEKRVLTFGEDSGAAIRIHSISEHGPVGFSLRWGGVDHAAQLQVPGRHNAFNAAGVFGVLVGLGFAPVEAITAIEAFGGTGRRFELHGEVRGVRVYDDYAHHPTEVAAALQTARSVVGDGRIIAIHQPHLYSRTRMMAGEFAAAYEQLADHTVVLDVFGAREDPEPGVTGALVAERFADASNVEYLPDWQLAAEHAAATARAGDIIMTLSCGDVYRIIPQVLAALEDSVDAAAVMAADSARN